MLTVLAKPIFTISHLTFFRRILSMFSQVFSKVPIFPSFPGKKRGNIGTPYSPLRGLQALRTLLRSTFDQSAFEIVISSGKVKQRTAPPALRNSLTGDTHTLYPQRSRMRPTRDGHAGITMTLPKTTEFAQKVSASSSSSTSGSDTSCSMIALLARSHAAGLITELFQAKCSQGLPFQVGLNFPSMNFL
jgi:hypothetical protein